MDTPSPAPLDRALAMACRNCHPVLPIDGEKSAAKSRTRVTFKEASKTLQKTLDVFKVLKNKEKAKQRSKLRIRDPTLQVD
jgi:hypothetical protein